MFGISGRTLALAAGAVVGAAAVSRIMASRYSFRGKVVVVTGGSRGLGLEMARRLVDEGARVAICARTSLDVMRAVKELRERGGDAIGAACDVTDRQQVARFVAGVVEQYGRIDVLINNAGVIQVGPLQCMTLRDFQEAMATHFWGPVHTIFTALPHMPRDGSSRIVNISSIGGKIAIPHLLPYSASKFALVGFSEGLRSELASHGVWVTTVCPGLMRTGSPRNAYFKGQHQAEYAWFSIGDSLPGLSIGSGAAARRIIEACRRADAELVVSLPARAATTVKSLFPECTAAMLHWTNRLLPTARGTEEERRKLRGKESFSEWSPSWLTILNEKAAVHNNEVRGDWDETELGWSR